MTVTILPRRGTAAQWTAANPILEKGEKGYETDTDRWKTGNGVATWTVRPYDDDPAKIDGSTATGRTVLTGTAAQGRTALDVPGLTAAKNVYTGQHEINGGFTNAFKTAMWIAPPTELNPVKLTQGLYVQHRVEGDMGGLVHDAAASELRLKNVSNPPTGTAAHECSLVVTGGVNDIGYTAGVLSNFHTAGTPTGTADRVSLFHAQQIAPLAAGFTIGSAISLKLEQQIVGTENWTIYAPDGNCAIGPVVAKDSTSPAVVARGRSDTVGGTALLLVQNSSPTTLFQVTSGGTGGIGGSIGNTSWWVNNNLASAGVVGLRVRAHSGQTANLVEFGETGGTAHVAVSAATSSTRANLILGSNGTTGSDLRLFNTVDQTTNYERVRGYWASNIFNLAAEAGGTGTVRPMIVTGSSSSITLGSSGITLTRPSSTAATGVTTVGTLTSSSSVQAMLAVTPTINQTGTGGYAGVLVNVTETATGSGTKRLIDAQVGGVSKFAADNAGRVTLNNGPMVIPGAGSPEGVVSAPVGSMFLRSDGGAATSFYIKESGSGNTGWVAK